MKVKSKITKQTLIVSPAHYHDNKMNLDIIEGKDEYETWAAATGKTTEKTPAKTPKTTKASD